MRFFRHKLAVTSLLILIAFGIVALFASRVAPYGEDDIPLDALDFLSQLNQAPSLDHFFGTDQLGRDYFSRVIYGIQTSLGVAIVVALLSTVIGTAIGAVAGYYGGMVDNGLMRFTDLILIVPGLAVLLVAAAYLGSSAVEVPLGFASFNIPQPMVIGLILAFLFWTGIARIVRGLFLSLREKEFVEAAQSRRRRRPPHHRAAHPPQLRGPDRRQHDADHRVRDPHRGGAVVPRLRHPAA